MDRLIPEKPAALRRATFEHSPNTHTKLLCLTLCLKLLLARDIAVQRDRKERDKKQAVSEGWESLGTRVSGPVFITNGHVLYSLLSDVSNTSRASLPTLSLGQKHVQGHFVFFVSL